MAPEQGRRHVLSAQVSAGAAKVRGVDERDAGRDEGAGQPPLSSSVKPIFSVTW
jgi:hypothetical protein